MFRFAITLILIWADPGTAPSRWTVSGFSSPTVDWLFSTQGAMHLPTTEKIETLMCSYYPNTPQPKDMVQRMEKRTIPIIQRSSDFIIDTSFVIVII